MVTLKREYFSLLSLLEIKSMEDVYMKNPNVKHFLSEWKGKKLVKNYECHFFFSFPNSVLLHCYVFQNRNLDVELWYKFRVRNFLKDNRRYS